MDFATIPMKKFYILILVFAFIFACSKEGDKSSENSSFLLTEIAPENSGIDFSNLVSEDPTHSIINYIYYYNGGGVAAGDINNDELPDLFFVSNMGDNKLYLNKGNFKFEDVSVKANINVPLFFWGPW